MSLTRKLLKELELTDQAVERIIAAHVETVDAMRQERDAALTRANAIEATQQERDELRAQAEKNAQAAASAQADLTAYREQVETERHLVARRTALTVALTAQGANPQAIPLLLDSIHLQEEDWEGDALRDAGAALHPYRAKYSAMFAVKSPIPVTKVAPPLNAGGALTHADIRHMSVSDINRNWSAVQSALKNN